MSDDDLPELPPDVAALLGEARGVPRAPESERRRVAARLAVSVGLAIPSTTLAVSRAASRAWIGKLLSVALVVAGAAGVGVVATRRASPRPPVPSPRAPSQRALVEVRRTASPPVAITTPQPTTTPPSSPVAAPLAAAPVTPAIRHATQAVTDDDRSFRDELALLERAHAALSSDDVSGASSALTQHARRFPHGRLEPEREALRVQCAAARGDREAASAARARFHQRFPDSVLGASVDRAVDGVQ